MNLDLIIGIDQTGAIDSKGKPKSLPSSVIEIKNNRAKFKINPESQISFELPSLEKKHFHEFLCRLGYSPNRSRVFIAIDSVIGLPQKFYQGNKPKQKLFQYFKQAMNHQGYGMKAAESFFLELLRSHSFLEDDLPKRRAELALKANSIFRARPFQKNIQTGSYRVWKDLSTYQQKELLVWPFEEVVFSRGVPIVVEAYPSLAWRVLNESNRQSSDLSNLYQKLPQVEGIKEIEAVGPNHKDAALIALYSFYLISNQPQYFSKISTSIEGAILGSSIL